MAGSTALAERSPTQQLIAQVRGDEFKQQVALALPSSIRPERFVRVVVTAIMENPEVTSHPESFFRAAIQAAQDGLLPDGREAAFTMFKKDGIKQVVYMPMVGGFRKIAAKHGINLVASVVRAGDSFVWRKLPPLLEHIPELDTAKEGEIVCAYAAAYDRDWRFVTSPIVMNVPEIEKVRAVSKTKDSGPWRDWWERMACKTVARRLFHELPLGDLEETERRIVDQADVDVDLPAVALTQDEADVAARLAGALPPADKGPDDRVPPARDPAASAGESGAPEHGDSDAEQAFQAALERLTGLDPDTDWVLTAERASDQAHGRPLDLVSDEELDQITSQMNDVADKLEAPAPGKES